MKTTTMTFAVALAASAAAVPATSRAQVRTELSIHIGLPVRPPLLVVEPGVQVVSDFDEEVFFVSGVYWLRRGPYWYRARSPRAAFIYVPGGRVPVTLARLPPPGHFRHYNRERHDREWAEHHPRWKGETRHGRGHGR
jgi:hypothetical protein